ncbi:nuclear transcription factor Y subunit A-7-like isoform X1 [Juglans microcarpa x Juglans regia]|uniref:nuclear transcription factor Y subunit A-7-like isoform X1 n=2 Tax=Juglans microcarpa x Juglans regia TaxID=2249226 RepID=UPI001B7EDF89|nr:nuclear transcription factor Y subunit A-7-like isoform X1 [Juglans microcarpa x Juglans regia]XP_041024444.1 nuclear transcription factor Y subunit A-7-like isoform X1 [Juglans microcarpa x Juglans regia]
MNEYISHMWLYCQILLQGFNVHYSLMTSSANDLSDNSEADEQQKHSESLIQSLSPATGMSHSGISSQNVQYQTPQQLGAAHALAPAVYPYPDPYYRSIFAPYDSQPYPPQTYGGQPMVHLQLMGIQQAGVPLPSDAVEEPVFVNAKQYHGIMRRRQSRAKAESENKVHKSRKPYLHESRHLHALRRARGCGGRFLNSKKNGNQQNEVASGDKSQPNINLNSDKNDIASSDGTS